MTNLIDKTNDPDLCEECLQDPCICEITENDYYDEFGDDIQSEDPTDEDYEDEA